MEFFALDIETDTATGGLDPSVSEVVSASLYTPRCSAVIDGGTERERLDRFAALVDAQPTGAVAVTWNGCAFDMPFLFDRSERAGSHLAVTLTLDEKKRIKYEPLAGHRGAYAATIAGRPHADIAWAFEEVARAAGIPFRLKPVARHFGIDAIEVDREKIHLLSAEENSAYNLSDSRATYLLADLLGDRLADWIDAA